MLLVHLLSDSYPFSLHSFFSTLRLYSLIYSSATLSSPQLHISPSVPLPMFSLEGKV
ncbi:hypothetical protein HMPREF9134_00894 [Porphyromonas catoniae F0037]|uniref:Uncharacterized protein n=1 Tax=Porphyromonas catoniae F0037 TaxID=1127696 RepID=L1NE86_9PORP|nr:hypothetical protein HMPREF9134_00894 [Porphyromonas catoniae F0037]